MELLIKPMEIYYLFEKLQADDFCFAYLDHFSDTSIDALLTINESRLNSNKIVQKKVSFLVTECFQNIVRHSEKSNIDFDKLFAIRSKGNYHKIITINPVERSKQSILASSIERLENLNEEELKQIYRESLHKNNFSNKGGAGLGLIEMARKSKQVPNYSFNKISEKLTAFKLELGITLEENKESLIHPNLMDEFYPILKENRVLIMQKGNFSQKAVLSLFELIENNLNTRKNTASQSKKLYLLIELLQNMSTNTIEENGKKNGIFIIKLDVNQNFVFETGNCIENKNAILLKKHLESIVGLSKIELMKRYNTELRKGITDQENQKGGIGLMEILKLSKGKFKYQIKELNEEKSFVSFSATIEN